MYTYKLQTLITTNNLLKIETQFNYRKLFITFEKNHHMIKYLSIYTIKKIK